MRAGHYKVQIKHRPGRGNIADFLSRHPLKELKSDVAEQAESFVNMIVNYSIPQAISKQQVLDETLKDASLMSLTKMIKVNRLSPEDDDYLRKFSKVFGELSVSFEGFIIRDQRLVLPLSLQRNAIQLAHEGNQDLRKTKELLRSKVWFPDIDSLTEQYYNRCSC